MSEKRVVRRSSGDPIRAQLITAAMDVITQDGLSAATTRRISEQAGLSLSTFHYWFSSKEELFECLLEEVLTEFEEAAAASTGWHDQASASEILKSAFAVVRERGDEGTKRQIVPYELTLLALRSPTFREFARRQYEQYRRAATVMAGPLLNGIDPRLPGGSDAVIQLVTALFDGLTLAWLADAEGTDPDAVFTLLDALFAPFRSDPGTRPQA